MPCVRHHPSYSTCNLLVPIDPYIYRPLTPFLVLALTVSGTVAAQDFRVIILLFVLGFTVVFAHSIVRLCVVGLRTDHRNRVSENPEFTPVGGYALPSRPIPIVLARDEEIGISGTDVLGHEGIGKEILSPPTYGLWRGSVVSPSTFVSPDARDANRRSALIQN